MSYMPPEERQLLETFLEVELELGEKVIRQHLLPQLTMSEKNIPEVINEHMDELPARMAFWGVLFAQAEEIHSEAEDDLEIWLAGKRDIAEMSLRSRDKKVTNDSILAEIISDDKDCDLYKDMKKRVRASKRFKEMAWRFCEAFETKGNMLQSIGANLRGERERSGGVHTYDRTSQDDDSEFAPPRIRR